ncbi:hypothetical protein C0J52_23403 [Blattella germanica]|nr:hypothetical protein C0J52_23403 [Blattella germanica]
MLWCLLQQLTACRTFSFTPVHQEVCLFVGQCCTLRNSDGSQAGAFQRDDYKSGLKEKKCLQQLKNAFWDLCPSQGTVYNNWFREFKTAATDENVAKVEQMLKEDAHCTYTQIQDALNIGSASVRKIFFYFLKQRKKFDDLSLLKLHMKRSFAPYRNNLA